MNHPERRRRDLRHPGRTRQRGLALVTAVLVVALVATVAASLSLGQEVWLRQIQNMLDNAQSEIVLDSALEAAAALLDEDLKKTPGYDGATDMWHPDTTKLGGEVAGGTFLATIQDAQGFFNVNNLRFYKDNTERSRSAGVFSRLLSSLDMDRTLVAAVMDWSDADDKAGSGGAEDIYYLGLTPPYRAANRRLYSLRELRWIKGFENADVDKLKDYISVLPVRTAVNVNTAPQGVLAALFQENNVPPGLGKFVTDVRKAPLRDKSAFARLAPQGTKIQGDYDVKSDYFIVRVDTAFGRLSRTSYGLLYRDPKNSRRATLLWKSHDIVLDISKALKKDETNEQNPAS